ncbi:hypothetical protein ACXZ9C_11780 [Streptococcus agalactiae]
MSSSSASSSTLASWRRVRRRWHGVVVVAFAWRGRLALAASSRRSMVASASRGVGRVVGVVVVLVVSWRSVALSVRGVAWRSVASRGRCVWLASRRQHRRNVASSSSSRLSRSSWSSGPHPLLSPPGPVLVLVILSPPGCIILGLSQSSSSWSLVASWRRVWRGVVAASAFGVA